MQARNDDNPSLYDEITRRSNRFSNADHDHVSESQRIGQIEDDSSDDGRRYALGLGSVDARLGLLRPGGMTVLAGLTGFGKTSLLEHVLKHNARNNYRVYMASLEMQASEIQNNMIANDMRITLEDFEEERRRQTDAYLASVKRITNLRMTVWSPPIGGDANIKTIFANASKEGADILGIDYASLLDGWTPGNEARRIVNTIISEAKASGIHVIVLAQLKSQAVGRRPTMDDIEDTKRLGQAARTVVLIHRPFVGKGPKDNIAEFIVPKNRFGQIFRGHSHWYGPTHSFFTMSGEEDANAACCKPKEKKSAIPPTIAPEPYEFPSEPESYYAEPLF